MQAKFQTASALTGSEFLSKLSYLSEAWLPARSIIQSAFTDRHTHHASGKILVFETFAPWKEHLFEVEKDEGIKDEDKPVSSLGPSLPFFVCFYIGETELTERAGVFCSSTFSTPRSLAERGGFRLCPSRERASCPERRFLSRPSSPPSLLISPSPLSYD